VGTIGTGIYTAREVARFAGLSPSRVVRWMSGYDFKARESVRHANSSIAREADHGPSLTFLDLIEVLFVKSFLEHGVKMRVIREAAQRAVDLFGTHHPFAIKRFETDGRDIFTRLVPKGRATDRMINVVDGQTMFTEVISLYLKQIEYDHLGDAAKWWPLGKAEPVLIDPKVSFGTPITAAGHVPTHAIHCALAAGDSESDVAKWFDIPIEEVRAAEKFQQRLAA